MPYREEPWTLAYQPPSFPTPDRDGFADIATVGIGEEVVGYLTRQDLALEWFTNVDPSDGWKGAARQRVEDLLRGELESNHNALDAWLSVVNLCPIAQVEIEVPLGEFYARLRDSWADAE